MTIVHTKSDDLIIECEKSLDKVWAQIDEIKEHNQAKVLNAFIDNHVQASHFSWVTGYGHDDLGKEKLDAVFASFFNTESAMVRPHFVSGTHAISSADLGNLKHGEKLVSIGKPYDTLQTVFKSFEDKYGINYEEISLLDSLSKIKESKNSFLENDDAISKLKEAKLAFIQRSRGYEWRDSLKINEMEALIKDIKAINPTLIVFVDNCYGEFAQKQEPTDLGADLIAGSLIKNPGGGIASAGGYVAGKKGLVHNAAEQLTAPGIGPEGGCMFDQSRLYFQGFFMAPLIVSEALKGMTLVASVFEKLSLETIPAAAAQRNDVIQAINFGTGDKAKNMLLDFCKIVQNNSPINSMFTPIADDLPGYDDQVVMGSGTFIEGSTIELSCDGPLREPYLGYIQGGLSYAHTKIVLKKIIEAIT